ncbi:hypothetical protein [uncultured Clostridium sp.]|uniref:hypothetical protein n=1 Tax=uncultured Clostridium sp. TaxID=59620 RepID=UPI0025F5EFEE|nr:hypothetical protein [uncultured Clostridium sp.]MDU4882979.1 hypothetical protein [Clostridium celatum]MDU7076120.1 hypothetical protein [Clostridium celatum]
MQDIFKKYLEKAMLVVLKTKVMQYVSDKGREWIVNNTGRCGINWMETDIDIQPMRIESQFKFIDGIKASIWEYCLCDLIIIWNDFLEEIINKLLDEYLNGTINIEKSIVVKYKATISLEDIVSNSKDKWKESFIKDFNFETYKDKIKIIEKISGKSLPLDIKLQIFKAIEIRNCIQHHNCILNDDTLKKLGCNQIKIYNNDGTKKVISLNSKIELTQAEIMSTRNALISAVAYFCNLKHTDWKLDKFTDSI